ncbi:hypothetical protein ABD86_27350 [Paenibacillus alvei]|nr:hypothetical protein [Paenibacillus alvei]MBG9747450.1 hypothetical protein [Paenibacillus alvei]
MQHMQSYQNRGESCLLLMRGCKQLRFSIVVYAMYVNRTVRQQFNERKELSCIEFTHAWKLLSY